MVDNMLHTFKQSVRAPYLYGTFPKYATPSVLYNSMNAKHNYNCIHTLPCVNMQVPFLRILEINTTKKTLNKRNRQ